MHLKGATAGDIRPHAPHSDTVTNTRRGIDSAAADSFETVDNIANLFYFFSGILFLSLRTGLKLVKIAEERGGHFARVSPTH